jgi:hypothetical protein
MPSSIAAPRRQLARTWTRCRTAHLCRQSRRHRFPLSNRVLAPTQRRRRPPVLEWASYAPPRADKRAHMRTASSTSAYVAHALTRSPAHWMRYTKLSSTERLKSAFTPPARLLPAQPSPRPRRTSRPALTPTPGRQPPTSAKQQLQRRQPHAHPPPQNRATPHGHHPRDDGVARRADSCSPSSLFMRHRVRRRRREWERIGASGQVLSWIRHGVRLKFKQGTLPRLFNHGTSMQDATPAQLEFLDLELPRFETYGAWEHARNSRYVSRMFICPNPVTANGA